MGTTMATKDKKTFLQHLGFTPTGDATADTQAVKKSYRQFMRKNHPDKNPNQTAKQKEAVRQVAMQWSELGKGDDPAKLQSLLQSNTTKPTQKTTAPPQWATKQQPQARGTAQTTVATTSDAVVAYDNNQPEDPQPTKSTSSSYSRSPSRPQQEPITRRKEPLEKQIKKLRALTRMLCDADTPAWKKEEMVRDYAKLADSLTRRITDERDTTSDVADKITKELTGSMTHLAKHANNEGLPADQRAIARSAVNLAIIAIGDATSRGMIFDATRKPPTAEEYVRTDHLMTEMALTVGKEIKAKDWPMHYKKMIPNGDKVVQMVEQYPKRYAQRVGNMLKDDETVLAQRVDTKSQAKITLAAEMQKEADMGPGWTTAAKEAPKVEQPEPEPATKSSMRMGNG